MNPDDFAIVIGISSYPLLADLASSVPWCANSARAFAAWLTDPSGGGLPPDNVYLIVNDEAAMPDLTGVRPNREDIDEAFLSIMDKFRTSNHVGRRFYTYVAGLGHASNIQDVALFTADASSAALGRSINAEDYAKLFQSSGIFDEIVLFGDVQLTSELLAPLAGVPPFILPAQPSGRLPASFFYAFASTEGMRAHLGPSSSAEFQDSLFTQSLLEGLNGGAASGDGAITSETLRAFIAKKLDKLAPEQAQPRFRFSGSRPIVFRPPKDVTLSASTTTPKPSPAPPPMVYPNPWITSDRWAERDALGYEPFARTVAMLITHADTLPPLTIGIKAPWGAGKTSLMKRVQYLLDGDANVTEENEAARRNRGVQVSLTLRQLLEGLRKFSQAAPQESTLNASGQRSEVGPVASGATPARPTDTTVNVAKAREAQQAERRGEAKELLNEAAKAVTKVAKRTAEAVRFEPPQAHASADGKYCGIPPRVTVWFNAWKYQTSEQIWAGLAHCIINQVTSRMSATNRELFWMKLHATRVDVNQLRWKARLAVLRELIPWLLFCGVLMFGGLVLVALKIALVHSPGLEKASLVLGLFGIGLSPVIAVAKFALAWSRRLGEKVSGQFREFVREPEYEGKLGFLHLVESDIREVLDLVAKPSQPLVIFVDDLDRCAPHKVAEIVEAVNLFLSGDYPNCIFVLGMEPAIVAAALEVANKDLLEKVREFGLIDSHVPLGWRFMEKIIQLPLAIPAPDSTGSKLFLDHLTGGSYRSATAELSAQPQVLAEYIQNFNSAPNIEEVVQRTERALAEATPTERPVIAEASRQAYSRKFTDRDPAISRFIQEAMTLFRGNPRQIKRYVNLFRFASTLRHNLRMDRVAAGGRPLRMPPDEVLTKFIALSVHWPQAADTLRLVQQLDQSSQGGVQRAVLLAKLEAGARKIAEEKPDKVDKLWLAHLRKLGLDQVEWLRLSEFRQFLASGPELAGYEECGLW